MVLSSTGSRDDRNTNADVTNVIQSIVGVYDYRDLIVVSGTIVASTELLDTKGRLTFSDLGLGYKSLSATTKARQ